MIADAWRHRSIGIAPLAVAGLLGFGATAEEYILVGSLVDFTGRTAVVGKSYGQGKVDAANWINEHGGINGRFLDVDTVDNSYGAERSLETYRKWARQGAVAIQGWGKADTEATLRYLGSDEIPYFSASYAAHLTNPMGLGRGEKVTSPYVFPMGPSYSDGARALISWAAKDWQSRNGERMPKYVHMGGDDVYSKAPQKAGELYAVDKGFDVLRAITYSENPNEVGVACSRLKESNADYAFLANTSAPNLALLRGCLAAGVTTQFMTNIWGYDENVMKAAGIAADGVVWVMGAATWREDVPGMKILREVSRMSDPQDKAYRTVHYVRGVCAMLFMKEAMEWADANGGVNGPNIRRAMYQRREWVPQGLEGVCLPGTWEGTDHRGFARVRVYRGHVGGPTQDSLYDLFDGGTLKMEKLYEVDIPRRPDWLGW